MLLLCMVGMGAVAEESEITSITVLADRALTLPLTQLASDYSRKQHVSVTVSFAPSFEQSLAVESGEPADLFISAHPKTLEQLRQQGVFDVYSITPLVSARLAWVTSTDFPDNLTEMTLEAVKEMKQLPNFMLAIANPAASAEGFYTQQVIQKLRYHYFLADALVEMQNTTDIVDFLSRNAAFGIMFESDALQAPQIRFLAEIPGDWHDEAVFTGAVVAGGAMDAARDFLKYLQKPAAQQVFVKYGFYPNITKAVSSEREDAHQ